MPLLWGDDPNVGRLLALDTGALELTLAAWDRATPADRRGFAAELVHELRVRVRRLDLPLESIPDVARDPDELVAWLSDPTVRTGFLEAIERRREAGP